MTTFNVQNFRAQMQGDGARPNLFKCNIQFPAPLTNAALHENFSFMCRAAQLPGSTINSIPVMYFGRELKFSGNRTFPEWTVTILNDENFALRDTFELWMSYLNSHVGNLRDRNFVDPLAYQAQASVIQYGKANDMGPDGIKKYRFVGMFPIDVSPIELDWGANDTIEEYAVTFAYQWWESNTTDGPSVVPVT